NTTIPTHSMHSVSTSHGLSTLTFLHEPPPPSILHSFPTRRSSDLAESLAVSSLGTDPLTAKELLVHSEYLKKMSEAITRVDQQLDRKSTRLNSSHDQISYAGFCLKKKNEPDLQTNISFIPNQLHPN